MGEKLSEAPKALGLQACPCVAAPRPGTWLGCNKGGRAVGCRRQHFVLEVVIWFSHLLWLFIYLGLF